MSLEILDDRAYECEAARRVERPRRQPHELDEVHTEVPSDKQAVREYDVVYGPGHDGATPGVAQDDRLLLADPPRDCVAREVALKRET